MGMKHWFLGWDPRETTAYDVAKHSLSRRSSEPIDVFPLMETPLRYNKLFTRPQREYVDLLDGKPFSTEFSFTRFLVPELCRRNNVSGWVGFSDCDFLFLADVIPLFELCTNVYGKYAVAVVQHQYSPADSTKMDGKVQQSYPRKLWSSFIMWNMDHPAHEALTPTEVNTQSGAWLHNFSWLEESQIAWLHEKWNWIPNVSPTLNKGYLGEPNAVHFSLGTPDMPGYEEVPYAQSWRNELAHLRGPNPQRERIRL